MSQYCGRPSTPYHGTQRYPMVRPLEQHLGTPLNMVQDTWMLLGPAFYPPYDMAPPFSPVFPNGPSWIPQDPAYAPDDGMSSSIPQKWPATSHKATAAAPFRNAPVRAISPEPRPPGEPLSRRAKKTARAKRRKASLRAAMEGTNPTPATPPPEKRKKLSKNVLEKRRLKLENKQLMARVQHLERKAAVQRKRLEALKIQLSRYGSGPHASANVYEGRVRAYCVYRKPKRITVTVQE